MTRFGHSTAPDSVPDPYRGEPDNARLDATNADSYYLNAPRSVASPKKRSGFGAPTPIPCAACYRPISRAALGYCDGCEASGAAARHRGGRP